MSNVLVIKSSILGGYSKSSALLDSFISQWQAKHAGDSVTVRDLAADPLPTLNGEELGALGGNADLNAHQQEVLALSNTLIDEIKQADVVAIAVPMYNFGIPVQLKAWFDLICRAGVTFKYTETGPVGLVGENKKVLVVTTTGGAHRNTPTDLALAHTLSVLSFIGLNNPTVAYGEALNMGPESQKAGLDNASKSVEAFVAAN
jgi:FMN-dependent NADH-azoreductase